MWVRARREQGGRLGVRLDDALAGGIIDQGLVPETRSKEDFAAMVKDEIVRWNKVVDESNGEIKRQ